MAAIGNLKAVLHFCQSGVNVNAQNSMNKWYDSRVKDGNGTMDLQGN